MIYFKSTWINCSKITIYNNFLQKYHPFFFPDRFDNLVPDTCLIGSPII